MDRWTPEETLDLIGRHRVTHTHLVPTMFHRLLRVSDEVRDAADVSTLQHVLHGAAPCPVPVKRAIIEWWGPVRHRVLRVDRGHRHVRDQRRVARAAGHGGQAADARPRAHPRPGVGGRAAARRGRHGVPEGAGGRTVRLLRRPGQDRGELPGRPLHDGRRRLPRRGRLPLPDRPERRPDHQRRGQRVPGRGRGGAACRTPTSATPR